MIVKNVVLDKSGRESLMKGIEIGYNAIRSTIGPSGQNVIIEDENIVGGQKISKDGVSVINAINLLDPIENLGIQIVREASRKSAANSGDGTTTTFVLAYAILKEAEIQIRDKHNKTEIIRSIQRLTEMIDKNLVGMSKKVTGKTLLNVATISANNDNKAGKLVADAYKGSDIVNIEHSKTFDTYLEKFDGIKLDRGFSSKFFVNNHKTNECQFNDCLILITDIEINSLQSIEHVLKASIDANKPLLIIGEMTAAVAATINLNVAKGNIKCCNIIPPSFGIRKENLLSDLAIATGGHFYSQMTGDNFSLVTMDGLGKANRVIVGQDKTIIIPNNNKKTVKAIEDHISELKESIKLANTSSEIGFINERIANISGSISTIYVGADTEIESKELYDRIEDAILATKSAIEQGILPGGGIGLLSAFKKTKFIVGSESDKIALSIVSNAINYPFKCIIENTGNKYSSIIKNINAMGGDNYGYDAKNSMFGDMISMGVIDPTKVVRNALKNAVSVSTTIMSTNCVISNIRA